MIRKVTVKKSFFKMNLISNTMHIMYTLTTTKFHATWTCTCVIDRFKSAIWQGNFVTVPQLLRLCIFKDNYEEKEHSKSFTKIGFLRKPGTPYSKWAKSNIIISNIP